MILENQTNDSSKMIEKIMDSFNSKTYNEFTSFFDKNELSSVNLLSLINKKTQLSSQFVESFSFCNDEFIGMLSFGYLKWIQKQ